MPEFVMDEIVRETCQFTSATALRLTGAKEFHRTFRSMKRRDGTAVQSGDTTSVGVVQSPGKRAICRATLTLGAEDTLTLDSGNVYGSTDAGGALPGFSSAGAPGEAYCTAPRDFFQVFDDAGNLLRRDFFRDAMFPPKLVADFLSELGTVDREAVLSLGVNAAFDDLGGLFAMDTVSAVAEDGEDIFENDNTGNGRVRRLSLKPWPTARNANILTGNALAIGAFATANRVNLLKVWDATGAHAAMAFAIGHAADPKLIVLYEVGNIKFEQSGTTISIRNNDAGTLTLAHIKPIIG